MNTDKIITVTLTILFLTSGLLFTVDIAGSDLSDNNDGIPADGPEMEIGDKGQADDPDQVDLSGTRSSRYIDKNFFVDEAQLTLYGANAFDYAGYSLAFGDVDNDGFDDLIMGVPYGDGSESNPRGSSGEVIVKFGHGDQSFPGTINDLAKKSNYDLIIYGSTATSGWNGVDSGDLLGFDVDSGDIDGDGYDDIVMGAPGGQRNAQRVDAGAVFVIYGRDRATFSKEIDLATDLDYSIFGRFSETQLGRTVAVGNFDNDQYDDIMVGNMYASPNGEVNAGIVYTVFGSGSLGALEDLRSKSADTIVMIGDKGRNGWQDPGDQAGASLAVGDVNGDNIDDMLIGAYAGQPGGGRVNSGVTYVILGSGSLGTYYNLTVDARVEIWGADANDYAAIGLSSGDINGDNTDDILIGAYAGNGQANNKPNAGEMYVIYGNPSLAQDIDLRTTYDIGVWGRNANDLLGHGLAAGNINGDSYDDFVVGARVNDADDAGITDAGAAYVFYGGTNLGKNLDPKNDGDGHIYGNNESAQVGFSIALGDYDNDGADDIAVMGYTADGELNARDDCGEVYLIYGKAPPAKVNGVQLLDSTGNPVNTIYSKYDNYTFRVNVTMIIGTDDIDEVELNLDPTGANLKYKWSIGPTPFTKVKDTSGLTGLMSVAGDAVPTGPFHYEIDFKLDFGWEYPGDGMLSVEVTAKGVRSAESTMTYPDVFEVEDDLEFYGSLDARDEEGTQLEEGSWVAGGETVVFRGLTPVYEGTTDVYPPASEFSVSITDDYDTWTNATASGDDIYIEAELGPVTNPEDEFIIEFSEPKTASPRGTVLMNLSVDAEMPEPPINVKFQRVLETSNEVTAVNSTEFVMTWPGGKDSFSGIRGYYYSLDNNEETAEGTFTVDNHAELTGAPTGLVDYYIWPVDNAGNIGKAVSGTIFVDLDEPVFSRFEPTVGEWLTVSGFNCTIEVDDADGSGIDTTSIRYKISTRGTSGYESWLTVTDIDAVNPSNHFRIKATVPISGDFEQGSENYIKFKLKDEAGNNFESTDLNLKIDTGKVEFLDETPDSLSKQPSGTTVFEITVADSISNVDVTTIQYRLSAEGASGYGDWNSDNLYPSSVASSEEYGIKYRVDLSLPSGKSNYIKFRAKDIAGNDYKESQDFRIWVNSQPQALISEPLTDTIFKENKAVRFSSAGSADADNDTLSYKWRSSIDGEFGYLPDVNWNKLSPGIHEITLEVSDGIITQESKINIEISSKESESTTGIFGASQSIDLMIILVLIIVIALVAVLFLRSRKQLKDKEDEAKRITPELVTPGLAGVAAGPGMQAGITDFTSYGLAPGAGGAAVPSYPQLPGTGAPQPMPTYDYGAPAAGGTAPQPQGGAPVQTGVVTPAAPQLPPAMSAEYPHLKNQQKLDLLEEKFLTAQISENLYMQLKNKYQQDMARDAGLATPQGEMGGQSQEVAAPSSDILFKRPEVASAPEPQQVPPGLRPDDWGKEEDPLSKIQIPGKEPEGSGPDLERLAYPGKVKKIKKY